MKTDRLTPDTIDEFIPNVLTEVEGERSLFDKLSPFLESAKTYLESEYLGPDNFLSAGHNDFALKILVAKAFADAVPSLDLVLTPTGMGVINTDNLAPASKERVERLIESLRSYVAANIAVLVDICRQYEQWRTGFGQKFCAVFLYEPAGQEILPGKRFDFDYIRTCSLAIEAAMEEHFIGHRTMSELRAAYHAGTLRPDGMAIAKAIRTAEILIIAEAQQFPAALTDRTRLWLHTRRILALLDYSGEYADTWHAEMDQRLNGSVFVNDIKGSYYF